MAHFRAVVPEDLPTDVLHYSEDRYEGVIVDADSLPSQRPEFRYKLDLSLQYWRTKSKRGIWLKLPIEKSEFIPEAVSKGFTFHHAEPTYAMMTTWLPAEESRLPQNATHQVGVGCIVINSEGRILLVQEKNGPLKGSGIWKLPTGLADPGEDISDAAIREVHEETGIHTEFEKILCFRQAHKIIFDKSDLFFICVLRPLSYEITIQEAEIFNADWLDPEILFEQKFFKSSPLYCFVNQIMRKEISANIQEYQQLNSASSTSESKVPGFTVQRMEIGFRPGTNALYFPESENPGSL
jgi:ADP-ribose pyrophosphatase YjhB (NUDIX family)